MQRKNRSPGIGSLTVVLGVLIGLTVFAADVNSTARTSDPLTGEQATVGPAGLQVQGTFASRKEIASSCRQAKRVIGIGPNFVSRASVKSLTPDCYSCCAEFVFVDDFESGDMSRWSAVVN